MTELRSTRDRIARTALFRGLPDAVLDEVASAMREVRLAAGQLIFSRGDPGGSLYLVLSGRVRLSILTAEGRELAFTHALAGDVFGEIALLDGSPRSADATALDNVVALVLSGQQLNVMIDRHPSLARAAIRFLCTRLREVSDHLEDIALLPLEARIARFLLNRAQIADGPLSNLQLVTLGISQGELALLIGASRQKVNAALMNLEQAGAISRTGPAYEIDPGLLKQLAQRDPTEF